MSVIYICGPMRGYPEHNFPAFEDAAQRFRKQGYIVHNPVTIGQQMLGNGRTDIPMGEYLRHDIEAITKCSHIALLRGWRASTGARAEVAVAVSIGLQFVDAYTMQDMPAPERVTICGGYERPAGEVEHLEDLIEDVLNWQRATFTQRSAHSITAHLLKEAKELHANPNDDEEWADVLLLAFALCDDGERRRDLAREVRRKLEVNKLRKWGEPDADGVIQHIKEA